MAPIQFGEPFRLPSLLLLLVLLLLLHYSLPPPQPRKHPTPSVKDACIASIQIKKPQPGKKKYKKKVLKQVSPYSELNNTAKNTSNPYTSNSDPCTHFRKNLQNGKNGSQNPVLKTTQNSNTFALKISKTHK
jgi:hypothetical protein